MTIGDPRCSYCGRPVLGASIYGTEGIYHPECTRGPEGIGELSDLRQRIERLERNAANQPVTHNPQEDAFYKKVDP